MHGIGDFFASLFHGCDCRNMIYVVEDDRQTARGFVPDDGAAQSAKNTQLQGNIAPVFSATGRDPVDEVSRKEILETIERIKRKLASVPPEMMHSIPDECIDALSENAVTLTLAEFRSLNLEIVNPLLVRKLVITDEMSEINKNLLFLRIREFQNIEELILQNCWELVEIPTYQFAALGRLRHLTLCRIFMDARYVGGHNDPGIKLSNLLEILNIPSLKQLTLQSEDFTQEHKQTLQKCAQEKGINISVLEKCPFKRKRG